MKRRFGQVSQELEKKWTKLESISHTARNSSQKLMLSLLFGKSFSLSTNLANQDNGFSFFLQCSLDLIRACQTLFKNLCSLTNRLPASLFPLSDTVVESPNAVNLLEKELFCHLCSDFQPAVTSFFLFPKKLTNSKIPERLFR